MEHSERWCEQMLPIDRPASANGATFPLGCPGRQHVTGTDKKGTLLS